MIVNVVSSRYLSPKILPFELRYTVPVPTFVGCAHARKYYQKFKSNFNNELHDDLLCLQSYPVLGFQSPDLHVYVRLPVESSVHVWFSRQCTSAVPSSQIHPSILVTYENVVAVPFVNAPNSGTVVLMQ